MLFETESRDLGDIPSASVLLMQKNLLQVCVGPYTKLGVCLLEHV